VTRKRHAKEAVPNDVAMDGKIDKAARLSLGAEPHLTPHDNVVIEKTIPECCELTSAIGMVRRRKTFRRRRLVYTSLPSLPIRSLLAVKSRTVAKKNNSQA
jgi:hypothetical protein